MRRIKGLKISHTQVSTQHFTLVDQSRQHVPQPWGQPYHPGFCLFACAPPSPCSSQRLHQILCLLKWYSPFQASIKSSLLYLNLTQVRLQQMSKSCFFIEGRGECDIKWKRYRKHYVIEGSSYCTYESCSRLFLPLPPRFPARSHTHTGNAQKQSLEKI